MVELSNVERIVSCRRFQLGDFAFAIFDDLLIGRFLVVLFQLFLVVVSDVALYFARDVVVDEFSFFPRPLPSRLLLDGQAFLEVCPRFPDLALS